jgi:hypothetical protein
LKGLDREEAMKRLVTQIAGTSDLNKQQHDQLLDRMSEEFGFSTELKDQAIEGQLAVQEAGYTWQQTLQNDRLNAGQKIAELNDNTARFMQDQSLTSKEKLQRLLGVQKAEQSLFEAELQSAINDKSAANRRGELDAQFEQSKTLLKMNQAFGASKQEAQNAFALSMEDKRAENQMMKMLTSFGLEGGKDKIKTIQVEMADPIVAGATYMAPLSIKESDNGDVTKVWFEGQWVDPALPRDLQPATQPAEAKARSMLAEAQDDIEGWFSSHESDYGDFGSTREAYAKRFMTEALRDMGYSYKAKQREPESVSAGVDLILKSNPNMDPAEAERKIRNKFPGLE